MTNIAMEQLERRLAALTGRGVVIPDPRQTYVDASVDLGRICAGAVLYPGTRLTGARTFVGPGAKVGTEGPVTLDDAVLGEQAEVASGFVNGAVLLRGAKIGSNGHVREGCLLEEEASTAHCVGLKHTILMSYVTFGSLINFCDALVCGGTSRRDHSEVGSGFIHFNFTAWGKQGDKATASLVGDVPRGVFLNQPRIFLGGMSGMIGPQSVGFGSITAAGQVIRKEVLENQLVSEPTPSLAKEYKPGRTDPAERRIAPNLRYIGNLLALKSWYEGVRLPLIPAGHAHEHTRIVTGEAIATLEVCIQERIVRLKSFLSERVKGTPVVKLPVVSCPLQASAGDSPYTEWIRTVSDDFMIEGENWLESVVAGVELSFTD